MQRHEEAEDVAWIYCGQKKVPATVRRVKVAESVVEIPTCAFYGHQQLEEVTLSSSVQVIGKFAFHCCKKLKSILYQSLDGDEEKEKVGIPSNVKVIDEFAFAGCTGLEELVLNEGLERIGKGAFLNCCSLTGVDFPSTVKVIHVRACWRYKLLVRLVLNEGLERIDRSAFVGCDSLSHVRIPQSVNSIATNAFIKCSRLISIELPEECSFNIDLSGCQSLVSLAGQISILFPDEEDPDERGREEFFQSSKLGSLVDDEADLTHRLNHRFDNSPLNKLCYYQSYHSLDGAMAQLRSLMEEYSPLAAATEVDEFGMTPLHVLSLSQTPNLDMLLAVMDACKSGHLVHNRDSLGFTPMDYLCLNSTPICSEVIRRVLQIRFDKVLGGLDKFWKSDMLQAVDEALAGEWASRKSKIGEVVRKFERKEILSLLELCLWKVKIGEATFKKVKIGEATSKKQHILADRQWCRIMSGTDDVIPHVLPFLDSN
eukprot:scaffold4170_cov79-Cylindrotheca_fusiformis.AAC.3